MRRCLNPLGGEFGFIRLRDLPWEEVTVDVSIPWAGSSDSSVEEELAYGPDAEMSQSPGRGVRIHPRFPLPGGECVVIGLNPLGGEFGFIRHLRHPCGWRTGAVSIPWAGSSDSSAKIIQQFPIPTSKVSIPWAGSSDSSATWIMRPYIEAPGLNPLGGEFGFIRK